MYQELMDRYAKFMKKWGGKNLRIDPSDLIPSNDGWEKDWAWVKIISKAYDDKCSNLDSWFKKKENESFELKTLNDKLSIELERMRIQED